MFPATTERVANQTSESVNESIRQTTEQNVALYQNASYDTIEARLRELDAEWDIERVLEANAATVSLIGLTLGATVNRKWFFLPAIVGGFLLQHALQGWCPPLPLFRRLGIRTAHEIESERYALKALRGDFDRITPAGTGPERTARALSAVLG
jgi:hypothetical protein